MNGADAKRSDDALEVDPRALAVQVGARWAWVLGGGVFGVALAAVVLWLVTARFEARAAVLVRTAQDPTSMIRQRLGPLAELAPSSVGGASKTELETELSLMQSRAVLGAVVDSLQLQLQPVSPARVAPAALADSVRLPGRFKPATVSLSIGRNTVLTGRVVATTRGAGATVRLLDREDAIDELVEYLDVRVLGGDVVRVQYRGRDSVTAALVPNLIVAIYLQRRKTVDRGVNQRRYEFLDAKFDSVTATWRREAAALRNAQEASGMFAPEPTARALLERVGALQTQLTLLGADQVALDSVLARTRGAGFDPRLIVAIPSMLKSPAVNELAAQLERTEAQLAMLSAQYTADHPAVVATARVVDSLRSRLVPLARAQADALRSQRLSLERDLAVARRAISALPVQNEQVVVSAQALTVSGAMSAGMGAQVLEARLAALTEGGDVRMVDPAVSPRRVAFPRPLLTLALGVLGGLFIGLVFALMIPAGTFRR